MTAKMILPTGFTEKVLTIPNQGKMTASDASNNGIFRQGFQTGSYACKYSIKDVQHSVHGYL